MSSDTNNTVVVAIQGTAVTSVTPTDGQVLTYDQTDGYWRGQTPPSSLPPNGSAGGDLSGTYPNPTVAKLQGNAVSNTSPTDGQILTWVNADSKWEPKTATSSSPIYGYEYATSGSVSYSTSFTQVSLGSTGPSSNTSYSSNNIVVSSSGHVRITGVISGSDGNVTATQITASIFQNGSAIGPVSVTTNSNAGNGFKTQITVDVVVGCSASDTFGLYLKRDSSGGTFTIAGASLTVWGTT